MSAGIHNIKVEQGATFSQNFTWKVSGNPVNLTGYLARLKVRDTTRRPSAVNEMISLSSPNAGIILGGAAGTIEVTISASSTAAVVAGKYVYDLELVAPNTTVTRLLKGTFTVLSEVTY
jgi:hypothetical protein